MSRRVPKRSWKMKMSGRRPDGRTRTHWIYNITRDVERRQTRLEEGG
jgi:hypothetical protein